MIIQIADEVFGMSEALELYQLFRLGLEERHLLLPRPAWRNPQAHALAAWLALQPAPLRELLELVLEQSIIAAAQGPSPAHQRTLRVVAGGAPRWGISPQLPLALACRLAEAPLKVLVENRRNDAAFIRACAPPSLRERLEHAENRGWIEFENGGGLPEMVHRVRADGRDGQEHRAARLAVIYDSDAKASYDPGTGATAHDQPSLKWGPSAKANEMKDACERAAGRPYAHRLHRRAIENYVPGQVLQAWAAGDPGRHKLVAEFLQMTEEQRDYFNMKDGLAGDRNHAKRKISPIYSALAPRQMRIFEQGFDLKPKGPAKRGAARPAKLADYFHEKAFRIEPQWMRRGQFDEIGPVIEAIIGMV